MRRESVATAHLVLCDGQNMKPFYENRDAPRVMHSMPRAFPVVLVTFACSRARTKATHVVYKGDRGVYRRKVT